MAHDINFDDVDALRAEGYQGDDDEEVLEAYRDNFFECNGCGAMVNADDDCDNCTFA